MSLATWIAATAYTALFVFNGWIPHDEGLLAQSAERVLGGQLPHLDFDDPYTGGLSFLHAFAFSVFGVRLSSMRILLFVVFLAFVPVLYRFAARAARPWVAAGITLLCTVWTLPNYFAAMPSWYNLFFAAFGTLALLEYLDTGVRRWLFIAGLCGGISFLIKLTGLYFIAAAMLWLVYREQTVPAGTQQSGSRAFSLLLTGAALLAWTFLAKSYVLQGVSLMEAIHFQLPIAAITALLLLNEWRHSRERFVTRAKRTFALQAPLLVGAAIPIAAFLVPYFLRAGGLDAVYRGLFILPRLRFDFARYPLPPPETLVATLPFMLALVVDFRRKSVCCPAILVPVAGALSLVLAFGFKSAVYQWTWFSLRPLVPLITCVGCMILYRKADPQLFLMLALAAFLSLVQYPYSFGIYFSYFFPFLALAILYAGTGRGTPVRSLQLCFLLFYLAFGLAWVNTGDIRAIGVMYRAPKNDTLLRPERAGLRVKRNHALVYEALISLIKQHGSSSPFIFATPDSPEVYFLSGKRNPFRTMYEFFDASADRTEEILHAVEREKIGVVVLNRAPEFSPPIQPALYGSLRRLFPHAVDIGWFQVLWRE